MKEQIERVSARHRRDKLVENRISYADDRAALSIYETFQRTLYEPFHFRHPSLVSMVTGKKVMRFADQAPFGFLPGESVVVPKEKRMQIDFPEADGQEPTRCLVLELDPSHIRKTLELLNETQPKAEPNDEWAFIESDFHLMNDRGTQQSVEHIIYLFTEDQSPAKPLMLDLSLKQLLVRLMQTRARKLLIDGCDRMKSSNRLAFAISYIKENVHRPISVDDLCDKVCMSQPTFYRAFKSEFGVSPVEFVTRERVKMARRLLSDPDNSVTDVCYHLGYKSITHFIKVFKKHVGATPKRFQSSLLKQAS